MAGIHKIRRLLRRMGIALTRDEDRLVKQALAALPGSWPNGRFAAALADRIEEIRDAAETRATRQEVDEKRARLRRLWAFDREARWAAEAAQRALQEKEGR